MKVLEITTHDGRKFYTKMEEFSLASLQELIDRTQNVYQVDHLEVSDAEYARIPITTEANEFFAGSLSEATRTANLADASREKEDTDE